jgi:transposase
MDLNQVSYQYFGGVDLMKIEGVSHATVLTLMSEVGRKDLKNLKQLSNLQAG